VMLGDIYSLTVRENQNTPTKVS